MPVSKSKLSSMFELGASLLELLDENPFKIKNWQNAALQLDKYSGDISKAVPAELEAVLGKSFGAKAFEYVQTGQLSELENYKSKVPEGVLQFLQLPGMGPKKARVLWKEHCIETIEKLEEKALQGEIARFKGFGEKTQQSILLAIKQWKENAKKLRLNQALSLAESIERFLQDNCLHSKPHPVKSLLVKSEVIDELSWIVDVASLPAFENYIASNQSTNSIHSVRQTGLYTYTFRFGNEHIDCQLLFEKPQLIEYRAFSLSASAPFKQLVRVKPPLGHQTSEIAPLHNLLEKAGLPAGNPVVWENENPEIFIKNTGSLIQYEHLTGTIHNHSTYSDGLHTLREMAQAAMERGWQYLGITDHSQSATYASGLSYEKIVEQHLEIDRLNASLKPFHIFKGIESDILPDGNLDYPTEILQSFDFIVASIHSGLSMDADKATRRLIKAIENPYTTILGHPTGRLLLKREGYQPDMKMIIDACAANKVCIEINANPYRLDIDWRWIYYCMEKEVMISINPDAHEMAGYDDTMYGLWMAQKGGLTKKYTLNAMNLQDLKIYFKNRKP